jgi:hypothetical protein
MLLGRPPSTVPANDGLRPDDRQCISNVRKQSVEADENQPVEDVEAEPLRRRSAPQDNDLLPKDRILGFK